MPSIINRVFGPKVQGARVVPLILKIVFIFTFFILLSNFFSNYVNLTMNRGEQIRILNRLLTKDLTDLHVYGQTQRELLEFTGDDAAARSNMEAAARQRFQLEHSMAAGVREDGTFLFHAGLEDRAPETFPDQKALARIRNRASNGRDDGTVQFRVNGEEYLGVYKWHPGWDAFFLRAEREQEFYAGSRRIFAEVSGLIVLVTVVFIVIGALVLRYILRFVPAMTGAIMKMQEEQRLDLLDMSSAPNDDVSYLGIAFNSLASTIDNLMGIFKKFVARDIAQKAYQEREVRLEGSRRDLTILFTDIRSFTYMTETLGTDIIKLLNLHYDRAIRRIHEQQGDIGSIIGDAVLAVFGTVNQNGHNKSHQAIRAGYQVHHVAASLRQRMEERRQEALRGRGHLTEAEKRVYKAVLLQVGVGIDSGEVFYGTIGSEERMTNTVIGDTVNSAARLEGLTRFYQVPVIASGQVKQDIEEEYADYFFLELDTVQVKGKTGGKQIYWPIERSTMSDQLNYNARIFAEGLQLYYEGQWKQAADAFGECDLEVAKVFSQRTRNNTPPPGWNGIWTMNEK